jgi:hypothetical protein
LCLEHLSRRINWKFDDKDDVTRDFKAGEPRPNERYEFRRIRSAVI